MSLLQSNKHHLNSRKIVWIVVMLNCNEIYLPFYMFNALILLFQLWHCCPEFLSFFINHYWHPNFDFYYHKFLKMCRKSPFAAWLILGALSVTIIIKCYLGLLENELPVEYKEGQVAFIAPTHSTLVLLLRWRWTKFC